MSRSPASLAVLELFGTEFHRMEVVAIAAELCGAVLETRDTAAPCSLGTENIFIEETGVVTTSVGPQNSRLAIRRVAEILQQLLPESDRAMFQSVIGRASSDPPGFTSLNELQQALRAVGPFDRHAVIRELYERSMSEEQYEWPSEWRTELGRTSVLPVENRAEDPPQRPLTTESRSAAEARPYIDTLVERSRQSDQPPQPNRLPPTSKPSRAPGRVVHVALGIGVVVVIVTALGVTRVWTSKPAPAPAVATTTTSSRTDVNTGDPDAAPRGETHVSKSDGTLRARQGDERRTRPVVPRAVPSPDRRIASSETVGESASRFESWPLVKDDVPPASTAAAPFVLLPADAVRAPLPAQLLQLPASIVSTAEPAGHSTETVAKVPSGRLIFDSQDLDVTPPVAIVPAHLGVVGGSGGETAAAIIEVLVNERGDVLSARAVVPPQSLSEATMLMGSLSAAKAWRFRPALKDGQPVQYRQRVYVALH